MPWKFRAEPEPPPRDVPPHVIIARGVEELSEQVERVEKLLQELLEKLAK
jgi:hypothetical protein